MTPLRRSLQMILVILVSLSLSSCFLFKKEGGSGRLVMFVGVDISGSFMRSKHFDDSLNFLAHYIYAHLNGLGGLQTPNALFVGSIGGAKADEAKTFFPIQTFQYQKIPEIKAKLKKIFPKSKQNPFTDYNAFFQQVAEFVESKNLVLKPISIMMISDGVPDAPKKKGKYDFDSIKLGPLETLARNITIRLIYTSADVGMDWRTKVKRQRVKIWTQDANVMRDWKAKHILIPNTTFGNQERFFKWIKDNVDFPVRLRRVN